MPKSAKLVIPNLSYNITQRGNNLAAVFQDYAFRKFYLKLSKKCFAGNQLILLGYRLPIRLISLYLKYAEHKNLGA